MNPNATALALLRAQDEAERVRIVDEIPPNEIPAVMCSLYRMMCEEVARRKPKVQ